MEKTTFIKTKIGEFLNEQNDLSDDVNNSKDLMIQALDDAFTKIEKITPQTKVDVKYVNIEDAKPSDIVDFMKENNIPENAYFGGKSNGYDGFDQVCLCYDIDVPTTDKEKLKFKKGKFTQIAFEKVFQILTINGYKRVGFNSGLLKQFDDTTIYDMYINKDFDRLVKYYSLYFTKK